METISPLAQARHLETAEKGNALELESSAGHLQQVMGDLVEIGNVGGNSTASEAIAAAAANRHPRNGWEPKGARAGSETPDALEIKRTLVERFAVGGYSYTNLADAMAEAKRDRLGGELR